MCITFTALQCTTETSISCDTETEPQIGRYFRTDTVIDTESDIMGKIHFFHHQLVDRNFQRIDIFEHVAIEIKHIVEVFIRYFGDFEIRGNTKTRFFYEIDCQQK